MCVSGYFVAALVILLGVYTFRICLRDFRQTRGSGTVKPYLYVLGALLSLGLIALAFVAALLVFVGPLH
jgi:hypothetical protein